MKDQVDFEERVNKLSKLFLEDSRQKVGGNRGRDRHESSYKYRKTEAEFKPISTINELSEIGKEASYFYLEYSGLKGANSRQNKKMIY